MDYQFQEKSKFALLTVNNVYTELPTSAFQLCDGTWIMPGVPVPDLGIWKEWLGSIRLEDLGRAKLVLFVEEPSDNPWILDAVHRRLADNLSLLFYMLHLRVGIEISVLRAGASEMQADKTQSRRANRGVSTLFKGLKEELGQDRLHQYVRSLEALILRPRVFLDT